MTGRFWCRGIVHVGSVVQTTDGDVVEPVTPDGSRAWLGLADESGRAVEYDGPVVRLACERYFGGLSSILLRRPGVEAVETSGDDVDCMACIALEYSS